MTGTIYGIGVGPGDPGSITLKAIETIRKADCIGVPKLPKEDCRAYLIAEKALPEIRGKEIFAFDFEMTKDPEKLTVIHNQVYGVVKALAEECKSVALLTIGDPTVYSTVSYIVGRAREDGLETQYINGITSFAASASSLGISLCEGDEDIHILSGQNPEIFDNLKLPGTKVIMKCGRKIKDIKNALVELEKSGAEVYAVTDSGLPEEKKYYGADSIPEDGGYMTTIIVKSN